MSKKTIRIIAMVIMMLLVVACTCYATTPADITPSTSPSGESQINDVGRNIIGIVRAVGIVISVVVLAIIGIKYMLGSTEEKAEYKKTFMPYIVGAILVFAASVLANVIYNFAIGL